MSKHPIFELAAEENARAADILRQVAPDAFAAYQRSQAAMENYKDVPNPTEVVSDELRARVRVENFGRVSLHRSVTPRTQSEAFRVVAAAESYLLREGARRTSRQITEALIESGVEVGGHSLPAQISRVSAHLTTSGKFNNDRAEGGYGLQDWPISKNVSF